MEQKNKLGQEPAFPLKRKEVIGYTEPEFNYPTSNFESKPIYDNVEYGGISKRFYAACAAMQGILSNPAFSNMKSKPSDISKMSLGMADELLKQEND